MSNLAVISEATSIASNVTTIMNQVEGNWDTRDLRKVGNKLQYSLVTLGRARQLAEQLELEGSDLNRAEALIDAFVYDARASILSEMR